MDNNCVFASFFTGFPDPQRNKIWETHIEALYPLVNSVVNSGTNIRVYHDCFEKVPDIKGCTWIKVDPDDTYTPNVRRWFLYKEFFETCKRTPEYVFLVDSTDVIMRNSPWKHMEKETIYTGDEYRKNMRDPWLTKRTGHLPREFQEEYQQVIQSIPENNVLINCGVFGAEGNLAHEFLNKLCNYHEMYSKNDTISLDTPMYIYTLLKHYRNKFKQGSPINTRYKAKETTTSDWWKHK